MGQSRVNLVHKLSISGQTRHVDVMLNKIQEMKEKKYAKIIHQSMETMKQTCLQKQIVTAFNSHVARYVREDNMNLKLMPKPN